MKTLVCIDGQENALKAVRLAAKFACTTSQEATFLFVQRHRSHTRTQRAPAVAVAVDLGASASEIQYLLDAEAVFEQNREGQEDRAEAGASQTALVQVGEGVFELGKVQLGSRTGVHLRTRTGIPQEEILLALDDDQYGLVMLGAHRIAGCPWSEIENGPLYVAERAPCPVMVIGKAFEEGQPILVGVGNKDLPWSTVDLIPIIATRMKSSVQVVSVSSKPEASFPWNSQLSSMIDTWSAKGLKVDTAVVSGDPQTEILKMATDCGLTVCGPSEKSKTARLGKVTKSVLCSQFNLLIVR